MSILPEHTSEDSGARREEPLREFLVEMHGDCREVYSVRATSADEAKRNWFDGDLVVSEAGSMEFYSVREDDE